MADFEEATRNWNQNWEAGLALGATYRFASPLHFLSQPWALDLEVGYLHREFDSPDPIVSATESRFDHEGWVRSTLSVPLQDTLAMSLTGELRRQYSNYDVNAYTNASAMVTLVKGF